MELMSTILKKIGFNNLEPISKGLSTAKFLCSSTGKVTAIKGTEIEMYDDHIPKTVLARCYSVQSHGSSFLRFADREKTSLLSLQKNTAASMLLFPRIVGQIKGSSHVINLTEWFPEEKVLGFPSIDKMIELASNMKSIKIKNNAGFENHNTMLSEAIAHLQKLIAKHSIKEPESNDFNVLLTWLSKRVERELVHGDFHHYNILKLKIEETQRYAVIDWEYGSLGSTWFDVLYSQWYSFGLQERYDSQKFLNSLVEKLQSSEEFKEPHIKEMILYSKAVLYVMALWFFERYRNTGKKSNLNLGIRYLKGGFELTEDCIEA